jgi:septal ring factor EnvC (AmiA/AmiB activator)
MTEILFQREGEEGNAQAEDAGAALALSADEFAAIEERVLRAVEVLKRERQARAAAEERAAHAESQLHERGAQHERLEREVKQLRAERDHVRERVDKLLKQLDALEL